MKTRESVFVEIRSGEGGDDAKDLVRLQTEVYRRYASAHGL